MKNQRSGHGGQIAGMLLLFALAVLAAMWTSGDIGVLRQAGIPENARQASGLSGDMALLAADGRRLTALVFYDPADPTSAQSTAMVYVNRTGLYGGLLKKKLAVGWFFRGSGPAGDGVSAFADDASGETAYYSANREGFVRAEFGDGRDPVALDPALPFALVADCSVTFYTADGQAAVPHASQLG